MNQQQPHGSIARQCTATSKRSGKRCRKPAMRDRTVCRAHGGATPRGIASPHLKHGRWSRDLPTNLASRYAEARRDPELLSLREEIALVDARISKKLTDLVNARGAANDDSGWDSIAKLIDQRRRLAESEVRHRALTGQMVALEQVLTLAGALASIVRRHVPDPIVLDAVQRDMAQLLADIGNDE